MPRGDGTGPWGQGPRTGRAAGFCAGYDAPGYANPGYGRGFGGGGRWGGGGRGFRHQYWATGVPGWRRFGAAVPWGAGPAYGLNAAYSVEQEAMDLEQQASWLREQLEGLDARVAALRGEAGGQENQGE